MIATENEMLFFLTWKRNWWKDLNITANESYRIRDNIHRGLLGRKRSIELLTAFDCHMVRDEIVLDSIWQKGEEISSSANILTGIMSKYGWYKPIKGMKGYSASDLKTSFKKGTLSWEKRELILTSFGYTLLKPEEKYPAIWELRPIFYKPIDECKTLLSKMIYNPEEV